MQTLLPRSSDPAWTRLKAGILSGTAGGPGGGLAAAASGGSAPILSGAQALQLAVNRRRACLIIQNNSQTGGPTLWCSFGRQAVVGQCLAFPPGAGLVIAEPQACPKEAVYTVSSGAGILLAAIYENSLPAPPNEADSTSNESLLSWGIPTPTVASARAPSSGVPSPGGGGGLYFLPKNIP